VRRVGVDGSHLRGLEAQPGFVGFSMMTIIANKRLIIGGISIGLIVFLWYHYVFKSQKADIDRLDEEIRKVETLVSEWVADTKSLADYKSEFANLESQQQKILSEIPRPYQVQELSQQLIDLGKSYGCQVSYVGIPFSEFFSNDEEKIFPEQNDVTILPLHLVVRGEFVPVGYFMEALADLPFFAAFGELEMSRVSQEENILESSFSMMVFLVQDSNEGTGSSSEN
jgi:Tfp pilus assembly protein PilO